MDALEHLVGFASTAKVQSLEWFEVATTLQQIRNRLPFSVPFARHVHELEEFLRINWSALTDKSKMRICRLLKGLQSTDPDKCSSRQFIKQVPTPLFMIALLEKGERSAWNVKIPRATILEVFRSIANLAPTNPRFTQWFDTLITSDLNSEWDAFAPLDQLKVLKAAIQTRTEVLQAQRNRKSREVAQLPSLPTSTELLAGVASKRPVRKPTKKKQHKASVYDAKGRRIYSNMDLAARSALPGQLDFHIESPPAATNWMPGPRHERSPHVLNFQSPSSRPVQQRRFEELGPMQLPEIPDFDPSLMPPPPPPGRHSPLPQLPLSHHSPPDRPAVTPFDYSHLNEYFHPREISQPSSIAQPALDDAYLHSDYHRYMPDQHTLDRQHVEAVNPSPFNQRLSHLSNNGSTHYNDNNSTYLQQMPSTSSDSSFANYHDQTFDGDGGLRSIQHGQGTGYFAHSPSFSGHNDSFDMFDLPHH